ncbi:hypothetical protein FNF27_06191 [Cafeteria roenbergensis]|uniref:glycine--tRNA ligase n=2 Tax=Cafeteria roenbergensis TaxID=33653 RepID=A0A5A8E764_CAFRO|nr:hypothetical protein FNF27_06191 [Cafeteria roenbergensis]
MAASAAASSAAGPTAAELYAQVATQGGLIRDMKAAGKNKDELAADVAKLKDLKAALKAAMEAEGGEDKWDVPKEALDNTLTRRMFVVPSFELYNGVAGLYDFGPPGTAFKDNLLAFWRRHFVYEEGMLQLECTTLTPEPVLKTSGHVDKFTDLMVKDSAGECFRADKLLEDAIDDLVKKDSEMTPDRREELRQIRAMADAFTPEELGGHLRALGVVSPSTGEAFAEDPFPFNLMFATSIGPAGDLRGFLRPETAQGMFMNFRRLLDYNGGRVPFAATQIGSAYRNEIAPRNGLLRVREFTMAEIEHFVHPERKEHPKFASVASDVMTLFPATNQTTDGKTVQMTIGDAVASKLVDNETLGYFLARTQRFLFASGIKPAGLRFRQHLRTEMAHYATDCWDAEILMASGWVECVGHADRSCYDLDVHARARKTSLEASERLPEPVTVTELSCIPNKGALGKRYKKAAKPLLSFLSELDGEGVAAIKAQADAGPVTVTVEGTEFELVEGDLTFKECTRKVTMRKFTPSVIEPSFGIGRVMQGVFEHTFYVRPDDEARGVFGFPAEVAPFKAAVMAVDSRIPDEFLHRARSALTAAGLSVIVDDSGVAIGRKYARADEVGVPFAVTIDGVTTTEGTVTVRERDSMRQIRVALSDLAATIGAMCRGEDTWESVEARAAGADAATSVASAVVGAVTGAVAAAAGAVSSAFAASPAAPAAAVSPKVFDRSHGLPTSITGTAKGAEAVVMEGGDRKIGRFARPAVSIL